MEDAIIRFNSVQILEINGFSRKEFQGEFTVVELVNNLVVEWLPMSSCRNCGRHKNCKYSVYNIEKDLRSPGVQCGFAAEALKNFILNTSFVLSNADNCKKQKYLDCAYYFCWYIFKSEQLNKIVTEQDLFKQWGWDSKAYSSEIIGLRDTLNNLSKCIKDFPELFFKTSVLFVEGESEEIFIENVRGKDTYFRAWRFNVECYNGKDNKRNARINMLLDDYKEKGYSIYFQGDEDGRGDGSGYDRFKSHINKGYLTKEDIFQFKYDFETAIPRKLLFETLQDLGYLGNVTFNEFNIKTKEGSINDNLKMKFYVDTKSNGLKKKVAESIGKACFCVNPKNKNDFDKSELSRFIMFLNKIK